MDVKALYEIYRKHPVITTDSRDCPQGSLFFALKGETFDGNRFAETAIEKGCAYAVIDDSTYKKDDRYILVDDVLATFKALAREHRRQFRIPVIGITGTNGKTTTKELVAAVLSKKFRVMYTQGNFNNDIGVPKTLFRLTEDGEIAVIEMGASHPGDIKTLAETAEPTCGIITNVGRAHLEGFGSFNGVISTKCELYDYLATRHDGVVFVSADNKHLTEHIPAAISKVKCYKEGHEKQEDTVTGHIISCAPFLELKCYLPQSTCGETAEGDDVLTVKTNLIGDYNLSNVLAAITIGMYFGVSPQQIKNALTEYKPTNNRSQFVDTGRNKLIVDAYNANPTSMSAALKSFSESIKGHRMAILGQMNELGKASKEEHQRIIDLLKGYDLQRVWLVGEQFKAIDSPFETFNNVDEVKQMIEQESPSDFTILIKGSNSLHLTELVKEL